MGSVKTLTTIYFYFIAHKIIEYKGKTNVQADKIYIQIYFGETLNNVFILPDSPHFGRSLITFWFCSFADAEETQERMEFRLLPSRKEERKESIYANAIVSSLAKTIWPSSQMIINPQRN